MDDIYNDFKKAYKLLYLKTRKEGKRLGLSPDQQDIVLGKLVNKMLNEKINNMKYYKFQIDDSELAKIYDDLHNIVDKWKDELDKKNAKQNMLKSIMDKLTNVKILFVNMFNKSSNK